MNKKTKQNKIKIIFFFFLITLILMPIVNAQTTQANLPEARDQVIQEHIRTRTEIKAYFDKKQNELQTYFLKEGQRFIDQNFKVFDDRMHSLATKMLIKLSIAIVSTILLAHILWYYIRKYLDRKFLPKKTTIKPDGISVKTAKPDYPIITDLKKEQEAIAIPKPTKKMVRQQKKKQKEEEKKRLKEQKKLIEIKEKQEKERKRLEEERNKIIKQKEELDKKLNLNNKPEEKEQETSITHNKKIGIIPPEPPTQNKK